MVPPSLVWITGTQVLCYCWWILMVAPSLVWIIGTDVLCNYWWVDGGLK